jgi:hypothetical protein
MLIGASTCARSVSHTESEPNFQLGSISSDVRETSRRATVFNIELCNAGQSFPRA